MATFWEMQSPMTQLCWAITGNQKRMSKLRSLDGVSRINKIRGYLVAESQSKVFKLRLKENEVKRLAGFIAAQYFND